MRDYGAVTYSLTLTGVLWLLDKLKITYKVVLRVFELFGLAARLEIMCQSASILVALLMVKIGLVLVGVLSAVLGFRMMNCLVYGMALSKIIRHKIWILQLLVSILGISSFVAWNYLQIFAGVMCHQLPKINSIKADGGGAEEMVLLGSEKIPCEPTKRSRLIMLESCDLNLMTFNTNID